MISIVIPCYEMAGRGLEMLRELVDSTRQQQFRNFEIIVSDDGVPGLKEFCLLHNLKYVTGKSGAAANLNNAIDHATRDIIKPMFQDDKFIEPDTLQKIYNASQVNGWLACTSHNEGEGFTTYDHVPYPHTSIKQLREGANTYGAPSAMAWRRNDLRFDENLKWLFDCEFYARMAERYGVPAFVDTPIYIRQWQGQATYTVATEQQRILDKNYVIQKYRELV